MFHFCLVVGAHAALMTAIFIMVQGRFPPERHTHRNAADHVLHRSLSASQPGAKINAYRWERRAGASHDVLWVAAVEGLIAVWPIPLNDA